MVDLSVPKDKEGETSVGWRHNYGVMVWGGKEAWVFTSTEIIKAYLGRGSWGVGDFYI